jgi:uncharacterized phage-associated protein
MQDQSIINDNIETTIDSILFILEKIGGEVDFHRIFKILYFAEKEHLVRFGKSFTGDTFIAMENGPVPSIAYDILKALKSEGLMYAYKERFSPYFSLTGPYTVKARKSCNIENIPESAIECIRHSIDQYGSKTFPELTRLSHDEAYKKAELNNEMSFIDIARAGGANESMIAYILESLENSTSSFY